MSTASEQDKSPRLLIIAITRMGDLLQASPAIAGFKQEHPNGHITVLCDVTFEEICKGLPGVDEIYAIQLSVICKAMDRGNDGLVDAYAYFNDRLQELRQKKFDICVNMASSSYTALLMNLLDVKDSRGWISDAEGLRLITSPWTMLFAAYVYHGNRDYNSMNIVDLLRCVMGVRAKSERLYYRVPQEAERKAENYFGKVDPSGTGPLICLQAGASQGKRQWEPKRFAQLCRLLIEKLDSPIIFTGTKEEKPVVEAILKSYSHPNMASLAGETNLTELAALLKRAGVLITGDTGTMHMSVAVGTPVVSLFLASAFCFETGPYSRGNLVLQPQVGCHPCNPNFPCARPDCHEQLSPELVALVTEHRLKLSDDEISSLQVSGSVADPRQIAIYRTDFDQDGFLEFVRINGFAERKGFRESVFVNAQKAYAELWKQEFGAVSRPYRYRGGFVGRLTAYEQLQKITDRGARAIESLVELIRNSASDPHLLGEANREIVDVEAEIENFGLSHPMFGAVTRMFVMERDNIRGDDPLRLAQETKEIYAKTSRRARILEEMVSDLRRSVVETA